MPVTKATLVHLLDEPLTMHECIEVRVQLVVDGVAHEPTDGFVTPWCVEGISVKQLKPFCERAVFRAVRWAGRDGAGTCILQVKVKTLRSARGGQGTRAAGGGRGGGSGEGGSGAAAAEAPRAAAGPRQQRKRAPTRGAGVVGGDGWMPLVSVEGAAAGATYTCCVACLPAFVS